ncbi:hypothetical protein DF268_37675 [Streptomyces sp. V2]|uniref:Transposase n=1 Tax=Streptomyces niveiscabiei TaxID=164115 RepID=A0ABW9HQH1_9ACTN|nr:MULTISPECIES: hypothetical protein [Streptomyces]PWG08444.1 hypothetical protein DF268_37675 [Streptomyces sp. V2]QZZ30494.1 hypothetical protein A7X85_33465 [Streptomyces sp. ST1015]
MAWGRRGYGELPCEYCGEPVPQNGRRFRKKYCGWKHRRKASRLRRVFDLIDGLIDLITS